MYVCFKDDKNHYGAQYLLQLNTENCQNTSHRISKLIVELFSGLSMLRFVEHIYIYISGKFIIGDSPFV